MMILNNSKQIKSLENDIKKKNEWLKECYEQIEKMKCCANCCNYGLCAKEPEESCDDWEMAEGKY